MKRLFIYTGLMLALVIGFTSCYKDIINPVLEEDPDGPPKQVSFKTELAPLFNSNCAKSGCHNNSAGSHKPYLETDISYVQIVNGGFVNVAVPKASILYINIYGEMSEFIPSKTDKQKVYDWIRNGAPNN